MNPFSTSAKDESFEPMVSTLASDATAGGNDRAIDSALPLERPKLSRRQKRLIDYSVAAGFVFIVLAIRLSLTVAMDGTSAFLLFLAAVMGASWFGGTGPGIFATTLSAISGTFFFMSPRWSLDVRTMNERVEFFLFLVEGVFITLLAGQMHKARNSAIAGQIAARALQAELLNVSDEERRRIGHDLHDGMGQKLTGVALISKALQKSLIERQIPEAQQAGQISSLANEMISEARHLARGLAPMPIQPEGLSGALAELCETSGRLFSIDCRFHDHTSVVSLNSSIATHLFHIAQEAVSNAVKHGRPRNVDLSLKQSADQIILTVSNDGLVFKPRDNASGMGLRIMKRRARLIGADLEISAGPTEQTTVTCRLQISPKGTLRNPVELP